MFSRTTMFRFAAAHARCLIPADGFYEWHRRSPKDKQPYAIGRRDWSPFFFAGIYSQHRDGYEESFLLFTTPPNPFVAQVHDLMPVILTDDAAREWLHTPEPMTPPRFQAYTGAYPAADMQAVPVSAAVGNVRNESPAWQRRLGPSSVKAALSGGIRLCGLVRRAGW